MPPKLDRYVGGGFICIGCAKIFTRQRDGARHIGKCSPSPPPPPSPLPNDENETSDSVDGGGQDGSDPWDGRFGGDIGDGTDLRNEDDAGIGETLIDAFTFTSFFFF